MRTVMLTEREAVVVKEALAGRLNSASGYWRNSEVVMAALRKVEDADGE